MSSSERPQGYRIQSCLTIGAGPAGARKRAGPSPAIFQCTPLSPHQKWIRCLEYRRRCLLFSSEDDLAEPLFRPVRHLDDVGPALQLACLMELRLPAPPLVRQNRLASGGEHHAVENRQMRTRRPWDLIAFRKLVNRVLPADEVEKVQGGWRLSAPRRLIAVAVRRGVRCFMRSEKTPPERAPQASADRRVDSDCHNKSPKALLAIVG